MRHFINPDSLGATRDEKREEFVQLIIQGIRQMVPYARSVLPEVLKVGDRPIVISRIFSESSTRTRVSHGMAATRQGCVVPETLMASSSSLTKGEGLFHMLVDLRQNDTDIAVVRHSVRGAAVGVAEEIQEVEGPENWMDKGMCVVVGGEGPLWHFGQVCEDCLCFFLKHLGMNRKDDYKIIEDILRRTDHEQYLRAKIIEFMDTLEWCFVGDHKYSRIVSTAAHLGRIFSIKFLFIAPSEFEINRNLLKGLKDPATSDNIWDAVEHKSPIIYFLRNQWERLTGTGDEPGYMSAADAMAVMAPYCTSDRFMDAIHGSIYHAQPFNERAPSVLKRHRLGPKSGILMQQACGIPLREAINIRVLKGRHETRPLITVPKVEIDPDWIVNQMAWAEKHHQLRSRYGGDGAGYVNPVERGFVGDRFESLYAKVHDAIFEADGVWDQMGDQVLPGRQLYSPFMGRLKATFWAFGYEITPDQAWKHGLVSAHARFSFIDQSKEVLPDHPGWQRVEFPLLGRVKNFGSCQVEDCWTRLADKSEDTKAKTPSVFDIFGTKGEVDKNNRPTAMSECAYCHEQNPVNTIVDGTWGDKVMHEQPELAQARIDHARRRYDAKMLTKSD